MLDARLQGLGLGVAALVSELPRGAGGLRLSPARGLGVVAGNPQAEAFWRKNGFEFSGEPRSAGSPLSGRCSYARRRYKI